MPDPAQGKEARAKALMQQFDAFLGSGAMQTLLRLLDTDIHGIAEKYGARRKEDGSVFETQELKEDTSLEKNRDGIYECLRELGFFDISRPLSSDYSRILILGASLNNSYLRTKCSAEWITPGVSSVDGLACFRPINPIERTDNGFRTDSDTEFGAVSDSIVSVFDLERDKWQDDFTGNRNLNSISCIRTYPEKKHGCTFRVFAAPSTDAAIRRADTGDTLEYYLDNAGINPGETLLAITNNRYCNRQFIQLAYHIIRSDHPVGLDVIGNLGDRDIVNAETYDPLQYLQDVIAIIDWIDRFAKL